MIGMGIMDIINDNELQMQLSRNLCKLKRCNKTYFCIFFTYIVLGLLILLYSIISMVGLAFDYGFFLSLHNDPISSVAFVNILDAFFVAPLACFLAYRGSYKQHDLCVLFSLILMVGNFFMLIFIREKGVFFRMPSSFYVLSAYSLICGVASAVNLRTNSVYHWLEQQQGFPQFNARFEQQKEDKFQRDIIDEFELNMIRIQKTSSDTMPDVSVTSGKIDKYVFEHKPDNMDGI